MKKIAILCIAVLFTSCGIYKSYKRPEVKTDGLYGESIQVTDTINMGNLQWKELFTDPYLQELIEHGLEYNTDLQSAKYRVEQAEYALKSARLAFLPTFALAPQGTVSSFDKQKASQIYQLPLTASWEIDVFGRIRNAKRKAKALHYQSIEYQQAVQTQLVAGIANLYYTLLMLDSQLGISQRTAENWGENVKTMRALKKAGYTTEAAVAQSEANYYAVESSVQDLKEQINIVENAFSILLADTPHKIERGKLKGQTMPAKLDIGVPVQLLSNRPDVKVAEQNLAQAFYATAEARSMFYPSITLSGIAGWTNNAGAAIINPGKLILTAIASLVQPLFNAGTIRARVKISEADQEIAKLGFQQSLLNAGAEVNDALTKHQTAKSKAVLNQKQIASLESAVNSTQLLMKHGTTTYLEVLMARQSLLSAELSQVGINFDEIQSVITLYRALGGGRDIIQVCQYNTEGDPKHSCAACPPTPSKKKKK